MKGFSLAAFPQTVNAGHAWKHKFDQSIVCWLWLRGGFGDVSGMFPFGCVSARMKCGLGIDVLTPGVLLWNSVFFSLFPLNPVPVSSQSAPQGSVLVPRIPLGCKAESESPLRLNANAFVPYNLCAFFRRISAAEPWGCTCSKESSGEGGISLSLHQFVPLEGVT